MASKGEKRRQQIVDISGQLFYHQGYHHTSFSQIAEAVGIPKGQFYYYFKTKQSLLEAVLAHRASQVEIMLADWNQQFPDPLFRLKRYVFMLREEANDLARYGCPYGSMVSELGKDDETLQSQAKTSLSLFNDWISNNFTQQQPKLAPILSNRLQSWVQGAVLLAHASQNSQLLLEQCDAMDAWLDQAMLGIPA